ncbi:MAG: hypothetical protein AVDCRST_MAG39-1360 [uncultured Sphingomonadaceae bacterium]|uniref:CHRD domain-containing protein n=1 Tax=uncultured Sphingomonadaceae bacterium TaxID=169976 RepID=A0A6J4SQM4_9SPHN|nr:MAG: hypothetical protein AVDCRST_MAG39-1360 [uncultured Sphingomonadaceae bacterium]
MNTIRKAIVAAAILLSPMTAAQGATTINVRLTNVQENPPVTPTLTDGVTPRPASFGDATLVLNDALTALTYTVTVFNIDFTGSQTVDVNDDLRAAHIHAGPNVSPTTNGPVVFGFRGTPFNDNAPNDVVFIPFADAVGGTISGKWDAGEGQNTTLAAQLPNLFGGRAYLNFHTVQFPGGEIRGNFLAVPEPATWMMMLLGFGAVGHGLRRRPLAGPARAM